MAKKKKGRIKAAKTTYKEGKRLGVGRKSAAKVAKKRLYGR